MDFVAVVDQVIALLRQRGRMTYRTLKRQFQLDDEALDDLKVELIEGQRLASDERGTVLVWTGDVVVAPLSAATSAQGELHPAPPADHASHAAPPAMAPALPDAERRQLTVLFCDVVDSTALSSQLDPETLREVVRAYQETCATVIARFDGYIAQYLGDGVLVYFGYPLAHEDDAQRAVRTGLGIVEALGPLNTRLTQEHGVQVAVRVGIHTGLVVVGEVGGGTRQEQLALGETPNIAARLQGLAGPNTVVVSAATLGLTAGFFTCQALGAYVLKGVETPLQVYQLVAESGAQTRLDVVPPRGRTPLVGRDQEVGLLLARWAESTEGRGQAVLLSGEAGIGKSRLVEVLREHVGRARVTWLTFRCSPYHMHSALYPVITHLQQVLHWRPEEPPAARLDRLEHALRVVRRPLEETVSLVAALLSVPVAERYPPLTWSPQQRKQKTYEALLAWLVAATEQQPVVVVWEDLHWADPSTLEWLGLVLDQTPTIPVCHLLTCRPEFSLPWAPRSYLTQLTLARLTRPQVEAMILRVTSGKRLPAEVMQQIVAKNDGVPLFVEELTKTVLESGLLRESEDHYVLTGPLPPLAIPTTLQGALMARLDRLAEGKVVAQLGAVLGRTFTYEVLQAVAPLDELALWRGLARLVQTEVLYQRGVPPQATYTFKHALIQDTAYQSLLRSIRRQYHQRTAQVMAARFPDLAEAQPELLAQHYTAAGVAEPAVGYWLQAGERSNARSAFMEAMTHCTQGLAVLQTLPDTSARAQRELRLQLALDTALQTMKGFGAPERGHVLTRAYELCQQVGDTPQLLTVLGSLASWHRERAEIPMAQEVAAQRLTLAQGQPDATLLMAAHYGLALELFFGGAFAPAHDHVQQALALATRHQDGPRAGGVGMPHFRGRILWMLGYPDQALTQSHQALALEQEGGRPEQLATVLYTKAELHWRRREPAAALQSAEAALALATEQGFGHSIGHALLRRGWALAAQGRVTEGLADLRQGLAYREAVGAIVGRSYDPIFLAEVYASTGQVEEGLHVLAEMRVAVDHSGFRCLEAEIYRLTGALLLQQAIPNAPQAEAHFEQALEVARRQQAKSYELRAATSLARLWQQQGKRQDAYDLLGPVYAWFTEGFDTADLQDAKALLEECAR